jgi:glutathione S-transferase
MQDPLPEPCLYGYWRSSAAYRVRIALNLKRITARQVSVQLQLGEQTSDEHRARNPAGLVPVWRDPDGFTLSQSLAIIDYLDDTTSRRYKNSFHAHWSERPRFAAILISFEPNCVLGQTKSFSE